LFVPLAAAVITAVGLDRLRQDLIAASRRVSPRAARAGPVALAAAVLLFLAPAFPYSVMEVPTPQYFRSSGVSAIPSGSVLLIYPVPGSSSAETMAWQAGNDFRYRMIGGYQNLPDGRGGFTHEGNPSVTRDYLDALLLDRPGPARTPKLERAVVRDLKRWDVATVVVDLSAPAADRAVALFRAVLNRPPRYLQGVAVWERLPFGAAKRT
jgi:hypothetical protein